MNDDFNIAGRYRDLGESNFRSQLSRNDLVRRYKSILDETETPEALVEPILEIAWKLVEVFVSRGFGIHPIQEVCGEPVANSPKSPTTAFNRVSLEDHTNKAGLKSLKPEA